MRYPFRQRLSCAAFLALSLAGSLHGQTLATITGEVRDASGAVVAGAAINVRNLATNAVRVATTNEEGIYSVPALNPGLYQVRAERQGFKAATRSDIELQVQQTARIDFALE